MALTPGTNCGFVTAAPSADPAASNQILDDTTLAGKYTSPAQAGIITEVGWYCDNATEAANFDVGLYSDDATTEPNLRLFQAVDNAKGTTSGWKAVTGLSWEFSPSTAYWLAVELDNTATATNANDTSSGGTGVATKAPSQTALLSDWGASGFKDVNYIVGIYALWTPISAGMRTRLNPIGGAPGLSFRPIGMGTSGVTVMKKQRGIYVPARRPIIVVPELPAALRRAA